MLRRGSVAVVAAAESDLGQVAPGTTPLDLMAQGAERRGASLVWLALSVEQPPEAMAEQLLGMNQRLKAAAIPLIVGGRGAPPRRMLGDENIHVIASMSELAAFARGIQSVRNNGQAAPLQAAANDA